MERQCQALGTTPASFFEEIEKERIKMAKRVYKKLNFSRDTICGKWNYSVWVGEDHILEYHTPRKNGSFMACFVRFDKVDPTKSFYDENGNFSYDNVEGSSTKYYRTIGDAIIDNPIDRRF